ncbi:hypothetical protein [Rhodanobacter soli]|jgi:hypothetical protein|uniref:ESPR domain-containing protein n=1 Tax=Rhodanobacter soli TaxID=590609 RepID=A0ABV2PS93_9GAMM
MRTVNPMSWATMLLLGALTWSAAATQPGTRVPVTTAAAPSAQPAWLDGWGRSADSRTLAMSSGGNEVSETIILNGTVANNTVDHVVTGSNAIGNGAFNGAAGVPMVIQNTGNGVLIQNATILNVQFQP